MIKDNNYIVIQAFMINELNLKGTELLVYAIIYGFSQDGRTKYTGTRRYLANWCNVSRQAVDNVLKKLIEKGLINKEKRKIDDVYYIYYQAKKLVGVTKNLAGGINKLDGGSEQSWHINNIVNNLDNNRKNERKELFEYDWLNDTEL